MQTLEPMLAELSFLKDMSPEHLKQMADCAFDVRFEAGQFIFREGEVANNFYIITRGKVALEVFVPGRGAMSIETIGEGEALGWSWIFPPYRWHFDGRALDLTRAVAFDAKCLRGKCDADHDLGYELTKRFAHVLMSRLQATRLRLIDMYGTQR